MLDEDLKHYPMQYIQTEGRYIPEIGDVWPGTTWMATAAAVHIGRQTGDEALVAKALKMSEAVANQIFDDGGLSTKGIRLRHAGVLVRGRRDHLPVHRLRPSPLGLAARRCARHAPDVAEVGGCLVRGGHDTVRWLMAPKEPR